jgi:hypothetical protein
MRNGMRMVVRMALLLRGAVWRTLPAHLMCAVLLVVICALPSQAMTQSDASPSNPDHTTPTAHIDIDVHNGTSLEVGDSLSLTITYRWPHGWQVETPSHEPNPARAFANEFVTSLPPPERTSTGEEERRVFTMSVTALHSGAWELPRPTMSVSRGKQHLEATASAVLLQVGADARPADLPPPRPAWVQPTVALNSNRARWLWGSALVLVIIALVAFMRWRRRSVAIPLTPIEHFARDWQAATSTADGKEAGARLSLALRRYVGALFAFDGPGSTTKETSTHLRRRMPNQEHIDLVRLLEQLDALRWGPDELPASAVRPLAATAQTWTAGIQNRLDAAAAAARANREQSRGGAANTMSATTAPTTSHSQDLP